MSPVGPQRHAPRAVTAVVRSADRRSWLTHGLAALAVSGLGLAVAASMALTTSAETTSAVGSDARVVAAAPQPRLVPGTAVAPQQGSAPPQAAPVYSGTLAAFAPRSATGDQTADDRVRAAVVKERAAQRAEDLSKTAEDASRLTRTAGSKARSVKLAATDREIRETAIKIATERRQRATAIRVAAEVARKTAEAAAAVAAAAEKAAAETTTTPTTQQPSTDSGPDPDTSTSNSNSSSNSNSNSNANSNGQAVSPVPGGVIGTPFGATGLWARYHTGLDFRSAQGTPIRAVKSGVVLYAGNSGNWSGNHVAIIHQDGYTTMSSHMSSMSVRAGDTVRAGEVIGRVGQTGRAFGAHLHFEVYPRGVKYGDIYRAINPVPWLRENGVTTR